MKLQKKFSVSTLTFVLEYLDKGYYPVDDTVDESAMISKVFGFGIHQSLVTTDVTDEWVRKRELPKVKKTARLDLTSDEACAILDMMSEAIGKDIDDTPDFKKLRTYLNKDFVINASEAEHQE